MRARRPGTQQRGAITRLAFTIVASLGLAASYVGTAASDTAFTAAGKLVVNIDLKVASDIPDGTAVQVETYVNVSDPIFSSYVRAGNVSAHVKNGEMKATVDIPYKWTVSSQDAQVVIRLDLGNLSPDTARIYRTVPLPANGTTNVNFVGSF